jgi:hypothetical protein
MTVNELFVLYQKGIGTDRKIVLCNQRLGDGFEIKSLEDFQAVIDYYGDIELYLVNKEETPEFVYFEFFIMEQSKPMIAIIRHPELTNAYFKEAPDRINDFAIIKGGIYRYIGVDYGKLMKDLVIEFPSDIDDTVWKFLKHKFPYAFFNNVKDTGSNFSIVFTTTDRFQDIEQLAFKSNSLETVYPELKRPTIKSVSQKFWKELKALN